MKQVYCILILSLLATLFSAPGETEERSAVVTFVVPQNNDENLRWHEVERALLRELQKTSFVVHRGAHWRNNMDTASPSTHSFGVDLLTHKNPQTQEGTIEIRVYEGLHVSRVVALTNIETHTQEAPMVAALRVMELIQSEQERHRKSQMVQRSSATPPVTPDASLKNTQALSGANWGIGIGFGGIFPLNAPLFRAGPSLQIFVNSASHFFAALNGRVGYFGNTVSWQAHGASVRLFNLRLLGGIRFRKDMTLQPQMGVWAGWLRATVQGETADATLPAQKRAANAIQVGLEPGLRLRISRLVYVVVAAGISYVGPRVAIEIEDASIAEIGHAVLDASLSLQILF